MTRATKTYTTKTDGVDDVLASHVNQLQIDVAKIWNTLAFVGATELTLDAAGAITATQNYHTVDTLADAASDDLVTISLGTNVEEAFFLVIRPDADARTVVIKHGTGNILCVGGHDITLDDEESFCILIYDAGLVKWMAFYQLYATAAGKALLDDADAAAQRVTLEIGNLPRRATCWADEGLVTTGNALAHAALNTQCYCTYSRQNAPANGDTITWSVFLAAGTYTISTLGITGTNRGIQDIYLDADKIVSADDWYAATGVVNTIKSHGSISVATAGYHKITSTVNGKHASSTDYYLYLTKIWLSQSAD